MKASRWEVLARIRQVSKVPVLMLTIKEKEEDIVKALERGADDYCTKPVGMKELVARVEAVFRRASLYESPPPAGFNDGYLDINLAEQRVLKEDKEVRLTPMEFNLVHYLLTREGQFARPGEILGRLWGAEYVDDVDLLRTCVWQTRRKIEPSPAHPRYIINRPGFGYRFNRSTAGHR
jgi:two-component system KDP operon response regulator KdpE